MKDIERYLNEIYDLKTDSIDEGNLYASNNVITCVVVSPHGGTHDKWMIRFSTVSAFDRWANSCAVEQLFKDKDGLLEYLDESSSDIYIQLLEYLSSEYDELER